MSTCLHMREQAQLSGYSSVEKFKGKRVGEAETFCVMLEHAS